VHLGFDELIKEQVQVSGTEVTLEVLDEPTPPEPTTIEIDGITQVLDEDTLEMYFMNKRKSNGGDIEEGSIRIEQTKAYLTFIDPKGTKLCVYAVFITVTIVIIYTLYKYQVSE